MKSYKFALTANAGLSITFPSALIWIDAVHTKKAPTYSTITPEIWKTMLSDPDYSGKAMRGPDALAFSHCHIDHFSSDIVREAMRLWPDAKVILPERSFPDEIHVDGKGMYVDVNDVSLHFIKTHHCTRRHHNKTHYSLMMNDGGTRIFMPMDSSMSDPDMHYAAVHNDIDIAIVDYVWVMMGKGREIIENDIRPRHLLIYHLQFEQDDHWSYRAQTREAAKLITGIPDVRILDTPFQKEIIEI